MIGGMGRLPSISSINTRKTTLSESRSSIPATDFENCAKASAVFCNRIRKTLPESTLEKKVLANARIPNPSRFTARVKSLRRYRSKILVDSEKTNWASSKRVKAVTK